MSKVKIILAAAIAAVALVAVCGLSGCASCSRAVKTVSSDVSGGMRSTASLRR